MPSKSIAVTIRADSMSDSDGPRARRLRRLCLENDLSLDGDAVALEARLVNAGLLEAREKDIRRPKAATNSRASDLLTESQLHRMKKQKLIERAQKLGVSTTGTKATLVAAILGQKERHEEKDAAKNDKEISLDELAEDLDAEESKENAIDVQEEVMILDAAILDDEEEELTENKKRTKNTRALISERIAWSKEAIAVVAIVGMLVLGGVVWWILRDVPFSPQPPRFGDAIVYDINNGSLYIDGEELIDILVDSLNLQSIEDENGEICSPITGTFNAQNGRAEWLDSKNEQESPPLSNSAVPGATWARDGYGRWHLAAAREVDVRVEADIDIRVNCDTIMSTTKILTATDIEASLHRDLVEEDPVRSDVSAKLQQLSNDPGQPPMNQVSLSSTTFGDEDSSVLEDIGLSFNLANLLPSLTEPLEPTLVSDIIGPNALLVRNTNGTHAGWHWQVKDTTEVKGGMKGLRVVAERIDLGATCLGYLRTTLTVVDGWPWPAEQSLDLYYNDNYGQSDPACKDEELLNLATGLAAPEGTVSLRYDMVVEDYTPGDRTIPFGTRYDGYESPSPSVVASATYDWEKGGGYMADERTGVNLTLEASIDCLGNDSLIKQALADGGVVWRAIELEDEEGWNLSWARPKSGGRDREAGWSRIIFSNITTCAHTKQETKTDAALAPAERNDDMGKTINLQLGRQRFLDQDAHPELAEILGDSLNSSRFSKDVQFGYLAAGLKITVDILDTQRGISEINIVCIINEEIDGEQRDFRALMDADTGRVVGWIQTAKET